MNAERVGGDVSLAAARLSAEVHHHELVKSNRAVQRLSARNKQLRRRLKELHEENISLIQALQPWQITVADWFKNIFQKKNNNGTSTLQAAPPVPEVRQS